MITKLNVVSIKVLDQDEALDFYVNKLGLEVAQDFMQGPVRWLTVRVPGDPDTEIYLEQPAPPAHDEATAAQLRELIAKGAVGWIAFQSDDVRAMYGPSGRAGHRLHPGAHRPLLRHRHGRSATPSATPSDPPAGKVAQKATA